MQPAPVCNYGHTKSRRPNGEWVCRPCTNAVRYARRKLDRERTCPHLAERRVEWLMTTTGQMVCLACVVDDANRPRLAKSG